MPVGMNGRKHSLGRPPSAKEMELSVAFVAKAGGVGTEAQREAAYGQFYQALFASIDFRYVN